MIDIISDTLLDTLKLIPFLFIAFLIIELIEHKLKSSKHLKEAGKLGPLVGSLLGAIPQCGFASLATNLYVTRIISLGTLIAIYLATSDEMLPIMLSEQVSLSLIIASIIIKVVIGIICGFIVDLIIRKQDKEDYHICADEHCDCEHNLLLSVLKHTLNISFFILVVNFLLNSIFYYGGEEFLSKILLKNNILETFITSIIGLIPNCSSSVILTELYINKAISYGGMMSGLLTNCGVGILILFKSNKNLKENLKIVTILYLIGSIAGILINLIMFFFSGRL